MDARNANIVTIKAEPEPIEVDLRRTAVMVIDMQNAFVSKGGFFDLVGIDTSKSREIVKPIKQICNSARAKEIKIIYVTGRYSPDLSEMGNPALPCWHKDVRFYREHPEWRDRFVIRGTWGAEIVRSLQPLSGDVIIEKPKYSAFFGTTLDIILQTHDIKYLVFLGVATNICVEASARDAYYRGYFPILIQDAIAPNGPQYVQEATIYNIKECYGWVTTSKEWFNGISLKKR